MKSLTRNSIAAAAVAFAALGFAGPATAAPGNQPDATGGEAMQMVEAMFNECMHGNARGIPRAVQNDNGVMFYCDR